jgi:hypothetical protein
MPGLIATQAKALTYAGKGKPPTTRGLLDVPEGYQPSLQKMREVIAVRRL